jgi:hypothetical protein
MPGQKFLQLFMGSGDGVLKWIIPQQPWKKLLISASNWVLILLTMQMYMAPGKVKKCLVKCWHKDHLKEKTLCYLPNAG